MRASSTSPAIAVGQTLDDKYQVLDVLGEGTMGTVYAAWHLGLEQRVALKVLRRGDEQYEAVARQRFRREARAAARIQSEFICRVLDTGTLADDTPYLVMEYLDGRDLAQELVQRGRLEIAEAIRYVRQTCAAVAEAHRAGIIHRDLKPANLFLQQSVRSGTTIKVLDFGVSKNNSDKNADLSLTRASALVGSPLYMSPEQLDSEVAIDSRTDIWALGAILVELITGVPPFDEDSIAQLVSAILTRPAPTFAERGCHVPLGLEAVVQKAMHKDRSQRYQTAEEMAEALEPFEGLLDPRTSVLTMSGMHRLPATVPVHSVSNAVVGSTSQVNAPAVSAQPSQIPQAPTRQHGRLAAVLLAGVFLGALAAVAFRTERSADRAHPRVLPSAPTAVPSSALAAEQAQPPVAPSTAASLASSSDQPIVSEAVTAAPPVGSSGTEEPALAPQTASVASPAQPMLPAQELTPTSESAAAPELVPAQEQQAPQLGAARQLAAHRERAVRPNTPAREAARPHGESAQPDPLAAGELPNFGGRR